MRDVYTRVAVEQFTSTTGNHQLNARARQNWTLAVRLIVAPPRPMPHDVDHGGPTCVRAYAHARMHALRRVKC